MRVVTSMEDMFDLNHDASASLCGFHWVTSGAATLEFRVNVTQVQNKELEGEICEMLEEGGPCQVLSTSGTFYQTLPEIGGLVPDISIDAENPGEICHCPAVSGGGREERGQ